MSASRRTPKEFLKKITSEKVKEFLKTLGYNFVACDNPCVNQKPLEEESKVTRFFYRSASGSNQEYQVTASLYDFAIVQWRFPFERKSFEKEWQEYLVRQYKDEYIDSYRNDKREGITRMRASYNQKIKEQCDELSKEICHLKAMILED